jgi:hypothetical protein
MAKKSSLAQYRPHHAQISQASIERPTSTGIPKRRKSAGRQSRNSQEYTSPRLELPRNSSERQVERRSSMCLRHEQDGPSGEASTRPLSRRSSFHVGHGDLDSVGTWSLAHRHIYMPAEAVRGKPRYPCATQRSKHELRQILDQSAPDLVSMTYTFSKDNHLDGVVSESQGQLLGRNMVPRAVPRLRHFGANRRSIEEQQPNKPVFMSVASTLRVHTIAQKPKKPMAAVGGGSLHMLRQIDEYCMDSEVAMAYRC